MPEMTREELVEELAKWANVSEEIKDVDGDEQLEYIYENTDLDPEIIEKLEDAEFEILYS